VSNVSIEVADDLAGILGELQQPIDKAALELIVLELYRRGKLSSGRSAELLGMSRLAFIRHASDLGIPYLVLDEAELDREVDLGRSL
jgi:predicted HTH domain antitoxin